MTLRRTVAKRRPRPRRDKGKGVSLPARSLAQEKPHEWKMSEIEALREAHAQRSYSAQKTDEALIAPIAPSPTHWLRRPGEYDVYGVDYPEWKTRKAMEKRSATAQATDKALKAPLAPTPEAWAKSPDRYDLPGVDTRQQTRAKYPRVDERNPMGTPNEAKKYLADVVEAYSKRLGVKGGVKLQAQKKGYPARIVHRSDGGASRIEVNYRHFGMMWDSDSGLTRRYLEYMVAHELAHQKQLEELGFKGMKRANKVAKSECEVDADNRAYRAMGVSEKEFGKIMDKLARRSGKVHVTNHPGFKGTPNLSRFEDHTPTEKPRPEEPNKAEKPEPRPVATERKPTMRELRGHMKATYVRFLGEVLPTATQAEREIIAEKAVDKKWIKGDETDGRAVMARLKEEAYAELVKMREEKAAQNREAQLNRLKELRDRAEAKKTDGDRLREKLALHREEYGVQYELNLDGALSLQAAGKRAELYKALLKRGYSKEEAAQISSTFNEATAKRIQGEALKKARRETMDLADDAYGELPELWEEGVKKSMAAEAATRHAGAIMEAAYKEVLGSIRDRTEPPKPVTPTQPTPKAQSESPEQEKPSLYKELESRKFWAYSGEDGDLYRANGLGGWRVQVYWGTDLAIQKKVKDWAGTRWITAADFDNITDEDHDRVMGLVDRWMKDPSILEEHVKASRPLTLGGLKESPPSPKPKTRSESYDFYNDPGHGWLRVPLKKLEELGIANDISPYSYTKGEYAYLEEDRDARIFTDTLANQGVDVKFKDHTSNRESSIRGYQPYRGPSYKRNVDAILAATTHKALEDLEKAIYQDKALDEEEKKQLAEYIRARSGNIPEVKVTPVAKSPTEEAHRRYDATMNDRIPRMVGTWRTTLRKNLLDQGYSIEDADAISGKLTTDAVYKNQGDFILKRRARDVPAHLTPELQAERDSLAAVQNEVEVLFARRESLATKKQRDELLPTLKKPTAFSPEYDKGAGMYEVEVYNPDTGRKAKRQFNTPDKAEQYMKLINENPGWPLEGFTETLGREKGRPPRHVIIAENTVSRGSEAVKYDVYERLPANKKKGDLWLGEKGDKPYRYAASGSTEYKEVPPKDRLIEDLAREYMEKGSVEVSFKPHPIWTPALSRVESLEPAQSNYMKGKWRVIFYGRDGSGDKREEGIGERWFDTHGEALDFIREGRGKYDQRGVQREGVWTSIPDPPTLPPELQSFKGKADSFEVSPEPVYKATWDQVKKQQAYHWVFQEKGGRTYTVDELRAARQAGERSRSEKTEAAKHSRALAKENVKRREWDRKAQPLATAMVFNNNAVIEAKGDRVNIEGMNGNHTALMVLRLPNDLGIPEGKYQVEYGHLDNRVTHLNHPEKVRWDNVERSLHVSKKDQESYINYEKVDEYTDRFPEPKVRFTAKARLDLEALEKASSQKGVEHLAIKAAGPNITWEATKHETRRVTVGEGDGAYETEERLEVPVSGSLGELKKVEEDEVKATYTASYISDNLGALLKAGFREATLEFSTDMPLKIMARRDDGAEAEFWLAPCIGV